MSDNYMYPNMHGSGEDAVDHRDDCMLDTTNHDEDCPYFATSEFGCTCDRVCTCALRDEQDAMASVMARVETILDRDDS